jgi:hypothetical protein
MYSSETRPAPAGNRELHFKQLNLLRRTLFATSVVTMMYFAPQSGQSKAIGSDLSRVQPTGISALIF